MRIRKLIVQGFKSFPDRTEFVFPEGLTCIVGPNGCGKTNIVDAIRFTLGEQSAKKLRGKSIVDMIFGGTSGKPPMNFSEASMTYAVERGELGEPYHELEELEVKRVLFRSGESEYTINRSPALLKDVHDLFYGTGLSPYTYGLMDQQDVTRIITMHAEERRLLLEEAAGITKFRRKRLEAERKMERTRVNLQRVQDVLNEVERQKKILERQARKAQRYRELVEELKARELIYYKARHDRLSEDLARVEQEESRKREEQDHLKAALSAQEADRQKLELESVQTEEKLRALREDVHRIDLEKEQSRGQGDIHEGNRLALERRKAEILEQQEALASDLAESGRRATELDEEARIAVESLNRLRLESAEHRPRRDECLSRLQSLKEREDGEQKDLIEIFARIAELERVIASTEARLNESDKRSKDLESRKQQLLFSEREFLEQIQALDDERRRSGESLTVLTRELSGLEELRSNLARAIEERRLERRGHQDEMEGMAAVRASLENLQEAYAGFHEGAREILVKWGRNGIKGTVAEILEVPERYRPAVEAVLGVLLEAIVTDTRSYSLQAMDYLLKEDRGRSFFIPLDAPFSNGASSEAVPRPANAERLSEKVSAQPGYEPIVKRLLSHVWVVDRLEDVFALPEPSPATFVTRFGEVYSHQGVLAGGARARQETASLAWIERKEKIDRLSEEAEQLRGNLARLDDELQLQNARQSELEIAYHAKQGEKIGLDARVARLEAEKEGVAKMVRSSKAAGIAEEEDGLRASREELTAVTAEARSSLTTCKEERTAMEEKIRLSRAAYETAQIELGEADKVISQLSNSEFQLEERHQQLTRSSLDIARGREQVYERMRKIETDLQEVENGIAAEGSAVTRAHGRLAELEAKAEVAAEGLRDVESALKEIRDQRGRIDGESKVTRDQLRAAEERLAVLGVERAKSALDIERIAQEARERWGVDDLAAPRPEGTVDGSAGDATPDLDALFGVIQELRDRRQKMGDVNMGSLEEYEELSQRFTFLTGQRDDIHRSIEQLKEAIGKINRVCRERFDRIFTEVSAKFVDVFSSLVAGGKGELRLVEPPPLPEGEAQDEETSRHKRRERGVDIFVKMPGKTMTNLSLLSGGERTLTAFSFLLSLFLVRPSPFCILDEVDAPLDDSNVGRFAKALGELGKKHPFLAITHNKQTMKHADTLIGVTMEQDGVSKLVSVKVN